MVYKTSLAAREAQKRWVARNLEKHRAAMRLSAKKRRAGDPEYVLQNTAYVKEWRKRNRARVRKMTCEQTRRWREKNRSRNNASARALKKKFRLEHPERVAHADKIKRAKRRGAKGSHTLVQWMARVEFYGWRCFYCKTALTRKTLTQDHRIPLSRNGTNFASNLVPACLSCNCSKRHAKQPLPK